MSIRCENGNQRHTHDTIAEVKACYSEGKAFAQNFAWLKRHNITSGRREHINAAIERDHFEALAENVRRAPQMLVMREAADQLRSLADTIERGLTLGHEVMVNPDAIREIAEKLAPTPRPAPTSPAPRGWYDLPIAASMWRADAQVIER